jgi:hypothetical protein
MRKEKREMIQTAIVSENPNNQELSFLNKKEFQEFKNYKSIDDKILFLNSLDRNIEYYLHKLDNGNILLIKCNKLT